MAWDRADEAMTQADEQDLRYVLDREGVAELLRRVVELVAAETALPVARILLYGSRARGDWLPESDVDVALVFDLEPDADGWTAAERALWGLLRGLRDCPGSDLLTCTPVAAAALEDPQGEYADFHRNIVAEGIEWRAGAALPEAVPHDRDAPPPWPHLPPPDFYLDRAARFFERVDRVPVKVHGPADAEWLQMAAHDILRAALLATGTAPPRTSAGRCGEFLARVEWAEPCHTEVVAACDALAEKARDALAADLDFTPPLTGCRALLERAQDAMPSKPSPRQRRGPAPD